LKRISIEAATPLRKEAASRFLIFAPQDYQVHFGNLSLLAVQKVLLSQRDLLDHTRVSIVAEEDCLFIRRLFY
jgi:hypothetical protein